MVVAERQQRPEAGKHQAHAHCLQQFSGLVLQIRFDYVSPMEIGEAVDGNLQPAGTASDVISVADELRLARGIACAES